jgi:putative aldouronate transport system permease protein
MYFSGGLIPTFLLVKSLGLYNQWPVMVILGAVQVWNVIIARTFLQSTIPEEMYEAALMEGANHWVFFRKIVLPLSQAIIAVLFLFYGVAHWNDFFRGLIYLDNSDLYPLQLNLRSILLQVETANNMVDQESMNEQVMLSALIKYGTIVVTALPVLVLYPFLQRYFVQGVLIGSLKG